MILKILLVFVGISILAPIAIFKATGNKKGKECMLMNIISFFSILALGVMYSLGCAVPAFAEATTAAGGLTAGDGLKFIGAALATGLSGIGGGIAVSSAASAAIGAMSENEKIMGKTLIFVALAEGIALYGLVISIMIISQ